jgi:hypothetical protein
MRSAEASAEPTGCGKVGAGLDAESEVCAKTPADMSADTANKPPTAESKNERGMDLIRQEPIERKF